MKKTQVSIMLAAAAVLSTALVSGQQIRYESKVVNIEIPVRVFDGDRFVDTLTIKDFEVLDNGVAQRLEAVYLVRKTNIERREEARKFFPATKRHFYFIFEMGSYDPKIEKAVDYFVNQVLSPGDELVIVTPLKTYRMRGEMAIAPERSKVMRDMTGLLRRDIQMGNAEYRDLLEDLTALAQSLQASVSVTEQITPDLFTRSDPLSSSAALYSTAGSFEEKLQRYVDYLGRLETLRQVDRSKLTGFAEYLRSQEGRKDVFLFYQREFLPKIDPKILNIYMSVFNDRPDIVQNLTGVFDFYRRDTQLDVSNLKKAFSNASASVHFLFVSTPADRVPGIVMEEQSEDIFAPFREMSLATGGFSMSSSNIEYGMKEAVAAFENYYLIYYTPRDYVADGSFHSLQVRVKQGGFRITHRSGYFAD